MRARFKGADAKGYRRRRKAKIALELWAVDDVLATADSLLETALHLTLSELLALPILAAGEVAGAQVWMRLHQLTSAIDSIERGHDEAGYFAVARLELRGELDLLVARGSPDPVGVIAEIGGRVTVNAVQRTFTVADPAAAPVAPSPPVIEGASVALINGLGPTTANELAALTVPVTTMAELAVLDVDDPDIAADLSSPATVRGHVRRAQLILATFAGGLPAMPPAADAETIADLLTLSLGDLATLVERNMAYAGQLRDELLTLEILLKGSALATVTLGDFR